MQRPAPTVRRPVGMVFDTGLNQIDDALAMALLYGFEGKGEIFVVAVSVSRPVLDGAIFCDVVSRFYAGTASGGNAVNGRKLPVGLAVDGPLKPVDVPFVAAPLARRNDQGKPLYASDIHRAKDTAEPTALLRNAFTAQFDGNAVVVMSGPATTLAALLDVPDAKALITRKVRLLVVAGGAFPNGDPELNIKADIPAARKLLAEWPTPIVMCGHEVGAQLLYPGASIDQDFAWSSAHPLVDAYRANQPMPYDAPTTAMAAVLYAVHPQDEYFTPSEPGTVSISDDGRARFAPSASGRHRYLILDPAQKDRIIKAYRDVASAKPVPRVQPRRPPAAAPPKKAPEPQEPAAEQ